MPRAAFRSSLLLMGTLGMAQKPRDLAPMATTMSFRSPADLENIIRVVQRWARAWHCGDVEAMSACLHPDLARQVPDLKNKTNAEALQHLTGVQSVLGGAIKGKRPRTEVCVLDVQGHSGSARVDLGPWRASMHLAAYGDGWAIENVFWERRG